MISTFGCNNGLILAGARAYYAMARDGLFFRAAGGLNAREGAGVGRWCCRACGRRSSCCRAPTTRRRSAYGNLYSNLLDYVISAALIFYILTIAGIFRLRRTRPDAERPYRAFGYPVVPALYIVGAAAILLVLFVYRTATTWPGLVIVLLGVPVYFAWKPKAVECALPSASRADGPIAGLETAKRRLANHGRGRPRRCRSASARRRGHPLGRIGIGRAAQDPPGGRQTKSTEDEVMLDAAVGVADDPIEHLDDRSDLHVRPVSSTHFARDRRLERLADFDAAARQAPLALERLVPPLDQQHATAVEHDGADADDRPRR